MKACTVAVLYLVALTFALTLVTGCSQPANENVRSSRPATPVVTATATPDELAFARANYARHCSECHGEEGKGGSVEVENVKLKVPSLLEGHALKHTDEDFVEQINNGEEGMPPFKDKLSPDEINSLVRFIRQEFQGRQ